MAWDVVSKGTGNLVLTAANINQIGDNFTALAQQNSGAPVFDFTNSGWVGNAVFSGGSYNANSGFRTTEIGSFGTLDVSSALVLPLAPTNPVANEAYQQGVIRAWAKFTGGVTPSVLDSFNVTGVAHNSTGLYTVTWNTDFGDADYAVVAIAEDGGNDAVTFLNANPVAGTCQIGTAVSGSAADANHVFVMAIGGQ